MIFLKNPHLTKRMTILVIMSLMFTLSGTLPALAQAGKVTGDLVNVRATPGTEGALVGTLPQGYLVQIVKQQGDWYQISSDKFAGWIRSDLLSPTDDASYVEIIRESVNLRNGPGTEYQALGQVNSGFMMLLIGNQGDWYKAITPSGTVVYVRSDMVQVHGQDNLSTPAASPAPQPVQPAESSSADGGCKVFLNGVKLCFDVQPCVENNRILVPVRVVFESAGATVNYDSGSKTVYARRGEDSITLPLNSTCPIVNGKIWSIDVPAKVINNRTLVPLRFAGEAMGGTVSWDGASETANISIPEDNGTPQDSTGSDPDNDTGNNPDNNSTDATNPNNGDTDNTDSTTSNEPAAPTSPTTTTTPATPVPTVNQSLAMTIARDSNGLNLTLQADRVVNVQVEENSGKVTYTFSDVNIGGLNVLTEALGSAGFLKASGRNEGKNAIIDVTWPAGINYTTKKLSTGRGCVFTIPNFVTGVTRENYGSVGERLMIETLCPVDYSGSQKGNNVELTLKNTGQGLAESSYSFGNYLIDSVSISETGTATKSTQLVIKTANVGRSSFAISGDEGTTLNVILIDKSKIWLKGSATGAIVLDPGHGGYDGGAPGAVSNEKDINLAIALKVRDILVGKGLAVEMTRDGDYYMGLDDRSDVANSINASLFVSIHSNSTDGNPGARGTETYFYAPLDSPSLYAQRVEREALATAIQNKLISYCGTTNRGVKEDNFSVLRKTNMPSSLTEVAFMSNVADETLLNSPAFQQMAAKSIAEGIMDYMKN